MMIFQGLLLTDYNGIGWMVGDGTDIAKNAISGYDDEDLFIPKKASDGKSIVAIVSPTNAIHLS